MMKKILTTLSTAAILATTASADFLRIEAGGGVWQQTPSGYATRKDGDGALSLDGTYVSNENQSSDMYAWILLKHPLPIIPNLRLEYVTITDDGKTSGKVGGLQIGDGQTTTAPTTIDMKQYDIIPYYNLLDNTFWLTLDLGVDIKIIDSDINVGAVTTNIPNVGFSGYQTTDTSVIPLLYLRTRAQIPTTGFGIEADIKAITDGTNTMYDARAKVDYTFDITPIVQPGIEIGYRIQKVRIDDGDDAQVDLKYQGVYAGVMLRF